MPPVTTLQDGDALLAIVENGEVTHHTWNTALSHAEFVRRTVGTLPDGAWVGTIHKFDGAVQAINSRTFYKNQLPAPAAVFDAVQAKFR